MTSVYTFPDKWLAVSIAPDDTDLEVCAMDNRGIHVLVFPCRKIGTEWIGFVSGITGIGGGVFLSPLLIVLGWTSAKHAAALSAPFILTNSVLGFAGTPPVRPANTTPHDSAPRRTGYSVNIPK
jgi:hypothetical protein